ncbi:hypothetical protein QQP08_018505 [Theobroma cacao]|nr:hypothetical protein QQP08_018505 [Theobroma cacao]
MVHLDLETACFHDQAILALLVIQALLKSKNHLPKFVADANGEKSQKEAAWGRWPLQNSQNNDRGATPISP